MQDFISKAPLVVELRADRPSLVPGVQRLRSIDFEQVMEIHDTLSAAQRKADDIVQRAVDVQEQARVDGRAEGRLEVRQELLQAVTDMQATLQHWVLQTEPQLIDMVLRCVREVVKETNPDSLVRGSIGRALTEMSTATDIRIQVHESQLASLRTEIEALTEQYALEGSIRIEGTPALKPGDCIVESPLGTVDLRIETQLKFVDQTLKQD
jgi:flagellar biosynthesis/type III secretory pathway protein FliH